MFGMDWRIFSKSEVEELVRTARSYGLNPQGAIDLDTDQKPITFSGRSYTLPGSRCRRRDSAAG